MSKKLTMLMILDGFGVNEKQEGNTVKLANIPHLNEILAKNPNTIIHTSGLAVGLPEGQMGNSEVGHTNIGARKNRISRFGKNNKIYRRWRFL